MGGLKPEIVAVAQDIELDRADWWRVGLTRTVLAGLWMTTEQATRASIRGDVCEILGISVADGDVDSAVLQLINDGLVFESPTGELTMGEQARELFDRDLEAVLEVEEQAFQDFSMILGHADLGLDERETWGSFNSLVLEPLILSLGARTYELIKAETSPDDDTTLRLIADLSSISGEHAEALREVAVKFLDPSNANTRSYVLRRLNASFFMKAAGMSGAALDALDRARHSTRRMTLLLDTNFVFSLLGLHENPSNEEAVALRDLAESIRDRVAIDLRVLPITVEESRRVLSAQQLMFGTLELHSNVASVASRFLSGAGRQYALAASSSESPLPASEFFSTYENNLITILREKGVELHNADLGSLRVRQDVLDDLLGQEEHQTRNRVLGAKPYESNLHDMVLYHFVRDARSNAIESPLDARYWVVTLDFGLIAFDRYAVNRDNGSLPICLHPATLMQLLRFWVPRDDDFDEALLGAFRLPFLQAPFDSSSEAMTIKILRRLSLYESIEELLPESIASILENDALRSRMETATDSEQQDEVIEQALILELDARARDVVALQAREEQASIQAREDREERNRLSRELDKQATAAGEEGKKLKEEVVKQTETVQDLSVELEQAESEKLELQDTLSETDAELEMLREDVRRRSAKWRWSVSVAALMVLCVGLWWTLLHRYGESFGEWKWSLGMGLALLLGFVWFYFAGLLVRRWPSVESWWPARVSTSGKRTIGILILGSLASIIAAILIAPFD